MTIKTLSFIHKLLEKENEKRYSDYQTACRELREYAKATGTIWDNCPNERDQAEYDRLKKLQQIYAKGYADSSNALQEFEEKEW